MIVLDSPKGWTGPKVVDGLQVEGTFRAHQVPLAELAAKPDHLQHARRLDEELPPRGAVRSTTARLVPELADWPPRARAAWAPIRTPTAACCCTTCIFPISAPTRVDVPKPGTEIVEATRVLGDLLRDVMKLNETLP